MKRFFRMQELFFGSADKSVKVLISNILVNLKCLTEDGEKILLSGLPSKEDIEESIDSLILDARNVAEMKNNLFIVKGLGFLSLQEENSLANRLLYQIGFSEVIETSITLEDALESEEELFEEANEDQ